MASNPSEEKFSIPKLEEEVLEFWKSHKIFEKSLEKTKNDKPFTFYDGPPFATGLPHYGHILASTIKDVVPRYQTMKGRFVRRRWGWDCHGLPIEEIVERKLGISGKKQIEKIGVKTFNETCRSMVLQYVSEWRSMIGRIARWVEFDDSYKTMDTDYMESVWWAFKQIYDKGLIYKGRKVLLYCPRCETPVSNFEVAMDNSYKDITETSVIAKFKLKPGQKIGRDVEADDATYILAWTTTPWTLPGNVALAVGEDIEYTALRVRDTKELYVMASELVDKVFEGKEVEIVHKGISGKDLVGLEYEPLFDIPAMKSEKSYKVYPADFVTTTDGTGIVHTAVVYGEDDYNLGTQVGLPVVPMLDEKGIFNEKAPEFLRGVYFKKGDAMVIAKLEEAGLLFKKENYTHSYPHCWRCGTALFYNAIPAWFVNVQKIKSKLLASNAKEINWFPNHLKHGRYEKSVESAPDWNISRNRYWGNPVPVWKCSACAGVEVVGSIEELSKKTGGPKNHYWVMRHGEAESNVFNIINSKGGKFHLTPQGREQVAAAITKLKHAFSEKQQTIDMIIASDVMRTRETEEIDAEILNGEKVLLDKRLEEVHLGPTLDGYNDKKYQDNFPTYESRFAERPPEGESLRDLRLRLWEFLKDCESHYEGKNILLVTHEYPAWMLFHAAEGWSEKKAIHEKHRRDKEGEGGVFIGFAEIRELDLKAIPRDDTGLADLHRPYIDEITFPCGACGNAMVRTPEIFDSWMEAGSMPFAEYHYPFENKDIFESRFPAQFVAEYIAQTRAWFYVMHVISLAIFGKAPFENVVTTGTILAEDGSKMSKSKNNFPDPGILIEKYGADSLRFYLMNSVVMQADNLNFSEKAVENIHRKVVLILWNVYKYFETYAGSVPSSVEKRPESVPENVLDVWIRVRTDELIRDVTEYLDVYDTVRATRTIQEYVDDLSTWYLRRSRKRKDAAFFAVLRDSLIVVSKVIAPFMPFLAEVLYAKLRHAGPDPESPESVHLTDWPKPHFSLGADGRRHLIEAMNEVRRLASLGLAERAAAGVKVRQPLASLTIKDQKITLSKEFLDILADEVNVKSVVFDPSGEREAVLDLTITPALCEEGLLRECMRAVQELRQKAGLSPGDKIVLLFDLPGEIKDAMVNNEKILKLDVGANSVEYRKSDKFSAEVATKINGRDVWIGIRKV